MAEMLLETLIDTLKSIPILFLVYLFIEWLQKRMDPQKIAAGKNSLWAPALGALAGSVPQCGFSAAYATLYNSGVIGAGTLVAVFIATSDEALPILLSRSADGGLILLLLVFKIVGAMLAGYLLTFTVFRRDSTSPKHDLVCHDDHCHEHHSNSIVLNSLRHTLKISVFIGLTLLAINLLVFWVGEARLEALLLTNTPFQPFFTALLGLVPGCATSVLMVELLISGTISFGSAIAGLATGAGFGFIILFKNRSNLRINFKILLCTYASAVVLGMAVHLTGLLG